MPKDDIWAVLMVDDEKDTCEIVARYLDGQTVTDDGGKLKVTTEQDFDKALDELASHHYDLIILDVLWLGLTSKGREEEEAGVEILAQIKRKRFLPVIFYTAFPNKVRHLETPLIKVVEKTQGVPVVLECMKELLKTKIPFINRELIKHVEEVQRDYMWDFVTNNWGVFGSAEDKSCIAYLLARRLSKTLDSPEMKKFAERLSGCTEVLWDEENVHPIRYYIIPRMGERALAGDIFLKKNGNKTCYMVLITPSCDISNQKADMMLFASCLPLVETQEYKDWKNNPEDSKGRYKGDLWQLLQNKKSERHFFLPGIFDLPDMVVDFQKLVTLETNVFNKMRGEGSIKCVASLDSPYAESLIARFTRHYGRLGVPDLNIELIEKELTGE
jgi:CheY-like chemotaxis protein